MNYPHLPARASSLPNSFRSARQPTHAVSRTRRYDIAYLSSDEAIVATTEIAPAMPAFEEAFSAFARGTLIGTLDGPVAVEDLVPGQPILTTEGPQRLRWRGSITIFPERSPSGMAPLTRVPAHTFGHERPSEDLVLGPAARFAEHPSKDPKAQVLTSPQDRVDGETALAIRPIVPVPVFHLVLDRQALLFANGIETASYHPALGAQAVMRGDLSKIFLGLFPHLTRISDFGRPHSAAAHRIVA